MKFINLLFVLLLVGCGGSGESGSGPGGGNSAFTLSKAAIAMKATKFYFSSAGQGRDKLLISTKETALVAAMPAGQQQPDWLRYSLTAQPNGVFQLDVEGNNAISAMKSALHQATIRVGTINPDGSFARYIDVPVSFDLIDFAEFSPDREQTLNGRAGALQPSTVTYQLRTTANNWQLSTDVSWLSVGQIQAEFSYSNVKVQATAQNLPQGQHTGHIIFKSADGRTTVSQPVSFYVEKPRWWLSNYAVGLSQLGASKQLETTIRVGAHDPKLLQSLQINTDAAWLQTQFLDNQLQLTANTAGLAAGMHYAKLKVSDPKASADVKTLWVGLFISPDEAAGVTLDLPAPNGKPNIYKYLADPLRPYVYVQTIEPVPQLSAYHLVTGALVWQTGLADFVLHEISLDGQQLWLKKRLHVDCEIVQLPLGAAPVADWVKSAKKMSGSACGVQTKQVDGTAVSQFASSLAFAELTTLRAYDRSLTRLDETDPRSDLLKLAQHSVEQVIPSALNDLTVAVSNIGGPNWNSRVTLLSTMVLPEQKQLRYFELAHIDNVEINRSFYAPVTNRLWTGQAVIDLQDGKMALTSLSQHCPKCWVYENFGVERRDGRVALLGQTYSNEVNDTAKRLMIFNQNGQIVSGSATNSAWQYGWSFGSNGIQLSADQQWLLIGSGSSIDIRRF